MSKKNKKSSLIEKPNSEEFKQQVSQLAALAAESRALFDVAAESCKQFDSAADDVKAQDLTSEANLEASSLEVFSEESGDLSDSKLEFEETDSEQTLEAEELAEFSEEELFQALGENSSEATLSEEITSLEVEKEVLPLQEIENVEETELAQYESVAIEQLDFVEDEKVESIIESILFSTDRPISLNSIKMAFKGTQVTTDKIKKALDRLAVEFAGARRGISLDEAPGGYQLRTKLDNVDFLRRTVKARPFKLSGPALEVLAIAAYKQPLVKNEIDQIRGVESGHLLRALMERGLVQFEGKSDLPGRPMFYGTTKKFLEIFGLRNLKELPTLSQIDELLPEGMDEEEAEKPQLAQITEAMSESVGLGSYSQGEEELEKIQSQLAEIDTTSEFFEKEKQRQKDERDRERATSIREALALSEVTNEIIPEKDIRWLKKYDEALQAKMFADAATPDMNAEEVSEGQPAEITEHPEMDSENN